MGKRARHAATGASSRHGCGCDWGRCHQVRAGLPRLGCWRWDMGVRRVAVERHAPVLYLYWQCIAVVLHAPVLYLYWQCIAVEQHEPVLHLYWQCVAMGLHAPMLYLFQVVHCRRGSMSPCCACAHSSCGLG